MKSIYDKLIKYVALLLYNKGINDENKMYFSDFATHYCQVEGVYVVRTLLHKIYVRTYSAIGADSILRRSEHIFQLCRILGKLFRFSANFGDGFAMAGGYVLFNGAELCHVRWQTNEPLHSSCELFRLKRC